VSAQALFLLAPTVLVGSFGAAMALNIFGIADQEAAYYRGRDYYPVMNGSRVRTHRFTGLLLATFAVFVVLSLGGQ
jgi:hypothetical protein